MDTGNTIKYLRKKNKMTQEELGNILGVKKSAIQKYEKGEVVNLKLATIRKLCDIFEVTPAAFIFPEAKEFDLKYDSRQLHFESKVYESVEDIFGESSVEMLSMFNELNDEGQVKVLELVGDFSCINKYKK